MGDRGRPEIGRDASPSNEDRGKEPDLTDEEI
jgi:hypothetical protein